jgi:phosphatidylglycerophosphatase A
MAREMTGARRPAFLNGLRRVLSSPSVAIATMAGLGFVPIWPGTVGSALALPLVEVLDPLDLAAKTAVYFVLLVVCIWAAQRAGQQLGEADHSAIICDETWSMAIVWELTPADIRWMLASFLAYRAFDAVKPWPICTIDRKLKNGVGVMLDDVVAAIAAVISIFAVRKAIARFG